MVADCRRDGKTSLNLFARKEYLNISRQMYVQGPNAKKLKAIEDVRETTLSNTMHPGNKSLRCDATLANRLRCLPSNNPFARIAVRPNILFEMLCAGLRYP